MTPSVSARNSKCLSTSRSRRPLAREIAREDLADYFWEIGTVEARLHAGDEVFQSDFERELYDRLSMIEGLHLVPQWPSRGKFIDLVVTDADGRRLAVEADGDHHHTDVAGHLIPEDVERENFLKEAGWIFHRIRHSAFKKNPDRRTQSTPRLAERPTDEQLSRRATPRANGRRRRR